MSIPIRKTSLRLDPFDYQSIGAYFVTICTHERQNIFGEIREGVMGLNDAGSLVWEAIRTLTKRFPSVEIDDACIIMPNHLHMIVWIVPLVVGAAFMPPSPPRRAPASRGGSRADSFTDHPSCKHDGTGGMNAAPTLGNIVGTMKGLSAHLINKHLHRQGFIWQRNYHDHIIRNDRELHDIRAYILDNPAHWETDQYH